MNKFVGMASVILLGALGAVAFLPGYRPAAPANSPLLTAYVAPLTVAPPAVLVGVAVPATVAGRVWEVYFTEGQRVRQGQLLLKVAQKFVSAERQRLQQLLARQQHTQRSLQEHVPAASAPELAAADALVAATERQLAALPTQLNFQFVTAPHDGVMVSRLVAPGEYLRVGASIGQLAPLPTIPNDTTLLLSSTN
ncbi:efflux RND transporter periplasmic adaptor subunit [Hymenobacter puniceus]|uniref:efflux RND transporter periplasmic adaptor subunit n=1 Tax=Hymenobacter sp. BT190 TaxID=2763505 RepID=UPI001650E341|nr:efflux RND transporter periplasmic adaptor subunit [Hymenobacter sp. BT190]MBC6699918.1 efflux RND transporter periplasmic adaptor subunit [Hymenobacter sp. BT190]